ncbi:unnamed protein product, partial [Brassica oleracea var. botrytis]
LWERSGNIRWWDVTTGQSSAFNSHRDEVRRTKFSHVVAGDRSRGCVAVLFNDNTLFVYDLAILISSFLFSYKYEREQLDKKEKKMKKMTIDTKNLPNYDLN